MRRMLDEQEVIKLIEEHGGAAYTAGTGIDISADNEISIDTNTVATKSELTDFNDFIDILYDDVNDTYGTLTEAQITQLTSGKKRLREINTIGTYGDTTIYELVYQDQGVISFQNITTAADPAEGEGTEQYANKIIDVSLESETYGEITYSVSDPIIQPDLSGYQTTANLVTSISSASTDTQYPSAKLLYDTVGDIESLLAAI